MREPVPEGSNMSSSEGHGNRCWLRGLRDLAQQWVQSNPDPAQKPPMDAYVDLMFAFGLAQLGEANAARELLTRGEEILADKDIAHTFLRGAFRYRITQALDRKPHAGPLPADLMDIHRGMVTFFTYVVDRLRWNSRILEPEQEINPYGRWNTRTSELDTRLFELADLTDPKEIVARVQRLLQAAPKGADGVEARARILEAALAAAPRVGEEFAREMLDLSQEAYDVLPEPVDDKGLAERTSFLETALFVAIHFNSFDHIPQLVRRFQSMLQSQRGVQAIHTLEKLAGRCFRGLRKLGMMEDLLAPMADLVLEGKDLASVDATGLRAFLLVASEWYSRGDGQGKPVLEAARALLLKGELQSREQTALACAYARTVGQAPVTEAQQRLEEIFTHVKGVKDTTTTSSHFSVSQLQLVESVVLGVTAGAEAPA
jgi:hypothetical protein